jgi:hypothetical protein
MAMFSTNQKLEFLLRIWSFMSSEGKHIKTRINNITKLKAKILMCRQSKTITPETETH